MTALEEGAGAAAAETEGPDEEDGAADVGCAGLAAGLTAKGGTAGGGLGAVGAGRGNGCACNGR